MKMVGGNPINHENLELDMDILQKQSFK